jgi:hypothetical protein
MALGHQGVRKEEEEIFMVAVEGLFISLNMQH